MTHATPLSWPIDWDHLNQMQETFMGLPLIGTRSRVWRDIKRQLKARPFSCLDEWNEYPDIRELAVRISSILREEIGWPNTLFLPNDPFGIIFWDDYDGLSLVCAIQRLEKELRLPNDLSFVDLSNKQLTYREVLEHVARELASGKATGRPSMR